MCTRQYHRNYTRRKLVAACYHQAIIIPVIADGVIAAIITTQL